MNRTVFSLPARSEYRTHGGLAVTRSVEQFSGGANRLDDLIDLLDRRAGVVLSSGTTVPGRYESFDLGFSDPPLRLQTKGSDFALEALNARGQVLIAFLGDVLRDPCVVITGRDASRLTGHIRRGAAPVDEDQRTRRASVMSLVRDVVSAFGAADEPLLGLFGAFAYDLVFQIEDIVQKRAREMRPAGHRALRAGSPVGLRPCHRARRDLELRLRVEGKILATVCRATLRKASTPKRRGRDFPIMRPANIRPPLKPRAQRLLAATFSKQCRDNCSRSHASVRRPKFSSGCAGLIRRPTAL